MSRTLRCLVQYDGTQFAGFQRQPARQTVQGALESALARVTREPTPVVGAGRTDAGVHATGQVVHFRSSTALPTAVLQRAMNACLPEGVAVRELAEAPANFHARFDALSREYRYLVENSEVASPLWRWRAHHVPSPLAVDRMDAAARSLDGYHDFAAFGSPMEHTHEAPDGTEETVRGGTWRTVYAARCWRQQRFIWFCFVADAFLRHMVRMVVGTLLRVGSGRLPAAFVADLLRDARAGVAGPAAPAYGLYLTRVSYAERPAIGQEVEKFSCLHTW